MAVKKVVINGQTKIDLTDTTATEQDVLSGHSFYNANGQKVDGALKPLIEGTSESILNFLIGEKNAYPSSTSQKITVNLPEGLVEFKNETSYTQWGYALGSTHYIIKFPSTLQSINTSVFEGPAKKTSLIKHFYIDNMEIYYNFLPQALFSNTFPAYPRFYNSQGELITTFDIPNGIFNNTDLDFSSLVDSYDYSNFNDDNGLSLAAYTTITLPEDVSSITGHIFTGQGLAASTLILKSSTPPPFNMAGSIAYGALPTDISIIVPQGALRNYLSATTWSDFENYLIEDTNITFSIAGSTYTIDRAMSWEEFINSEYNDGKFTLGDLVKQTEEGQSIYYVNYEGTPIFSSDSGYVYPDCPISSVGYVKPVTYNKQGA